jgi:hypothetical protein
MTLGIVNSGGGIGDKVVYTSLPENYFANTGERLIDVGRSWEYDHNPFVMRDVVPDNVIDLWRLPLCGGNCSSLAWRICKALGLPKLVLRHARLYAFENEVVNHNALAVHTTGKTAGDMPRHVIDHIAAAYKGYAIYQVGNNDDCPTPFIDRRGLPLWESIRLVATCGTFIGIDSGMMNVANCYPRVRRKVVLLGEFADEPPVSERIRWIDFGWEYFNAADHDSGIAMTYRKIAP